MNQRRLIGQELEKQLTKIIKIQPFTPPHNTKRLKTIYWSQVWFSRVNSVLYSGFKNHFVPFLDTMFESYNYVLLFKQTTQIRNYAISFCNE